LPAGDEAVEAVYERGLLEEGGERLEIDGTEGAAVLPDLDIAEEDHPAVRARLLLAPREPARLHVVLQDADDLPGVVERDRLRLVEDEGVVAGEEARRVRAV